SEKAFKKSLTIAKNNNSRLILTHVIDSKTFATAEAYDRTLAERADEYATELLDRYEEKAKEINSDLLIKCIDYGSPKLKIAREIAQRYDADLIICGA